MSGNTHSGIMVWGWPTPLRLTVLNPAKHRAWFGPCGSPTLYVLVPFPSMTSTLQGLVKNSSYLIVK